MHMCVYIFPDEAAKDVVTVFGAGVDLHSMLNPGDMRPVGTFVPGGGLGFRV